MNNENPKRSHHRKSGPKAPRRRQLACYNCHNGQAPGDREKKRPCVKCGSVAFFELPDGVDSARITGRRGIIPSLEVRGGLSLDGVEAGEGD